MRLHSGFCLLLSKSVFHLCLLPIIGSVAEKLPPPNPMTCTKQPVRTRRPASRPGLSPDTAARLVTVDTARACLGLTAEAVFERAEDHLTPGHLPAFDLNVKNFGHAHRRELRLWARAIVACRINRDRSRSLPGGIWQPSYTSKKPGPRRRKSSPIVC